MNTGKKLRRPLQWFLFCFVFLMMTWIVLVIGNGKNLTDSRKFSGKIDSTWNSVQIIFSKSSQKWIFGYRGQNYFKSLCYI